MKPKIFIVDDEAPARNRLKALLADIAEECPHELAGEAGRAQQALEGIAAARPDIVLLDVQMPGMTGLELCDRLAELAPRAPAVIFVTAYDEYALKAFEVRALDYLLKPVRASRLAAAILRASQLHGQPAARDGKAPDEPAASPPRRQHLSVQERGRVLMVPVAEILYLKAELKYVTLRTRTHEYLIEESLTSMEDEFSATFVRVHRNALVARDAIIGVERSLHPGETGQETWQVLLRDVDERLPISRRQWPAIKALVR